jgi:transposase-like protein
MPWKEHRKMSLKMEFVEKASRPGARMAELCRQYGIARETGYKWLNRFKRESYAGLEEKSRAPHSSPLQASAPEPRDLTNELHDPTVRLHGLRNELRDLRRQTSLLRLRPFHAAQGS